MELVFNNPTDAHQPFAQGNSRATIHLTTRMVLCTAICLLSLMTTGCATLATLGLPVGGTSNRILGSAKSISEAPGESLQLPNEFQKVPIDTYVLEIGDTIFVEPISFDATIRLPGDQVVQPDGTISIGEFGTFYAVYKTIEQTRFEIQAIIDDRIRSDLENTFVQEQRREEQLKLNAAKADSGKTSDPKTANTQAEQSTLEIKLQLLERQIGERIEQNRISVRLVNWDSKRIYVLGEVNSPGYFSYTGSQTVLDAILEAGGLNGKANHHQIIVSRPTSGGSCRIVMTVCYDQVVQLGDTSTNYQLLPGDRVFVPGLTFWDDLKKSFSVDKDPKCPRCGPQQRGCDLPSGSLPPIYEPGIFQRILNPQSSSPESIVEINSASAG